MQNCGNCKKWLAKDEVTPNGIRPGICRAAPPCATLIPQQGIGGQGLAVVSYRPESNNGDWCAEWAEGVDASNILAS